MFIHYVMTCMNGPTRGLVGASDDSSGISDGGPGVRQAVRHPPSARTHASPPCPVTALPVSCKKADQPVRQTNTTTPKAARFQQGPDGVPLPALPGGHRGARARVAAIVIVTFSSRGWWGIRGGTRCSRATPPDFPALGGCPQSADEGCGCRKPHPCAVTCNFPGPTEDRRTGSREDHPLCSCDCPTSPSPA
jgi:hypothetical protein